MVEMKIILRTFLIIIVVFISSLFFYDMDEKKQRVLVNKEENKVVELAAIEIESSEEEKKFVILEDSIFRFMGQSTEQLIETLGLPIRKDPSMFDYEWWIYSINEKEYYQIGVLDGLVTTIYAIGEEAKVGPFKIGQDINFVFNEVPVFTEVVIENELGTYRFELSEDQYYAKPLVYLDDYYAQIYIDRFSGTISSIRVFDEMTLLKQRPYEMVYLGEFIAPNMLDAQQIVAVNEGIKKQIFDITNIVRARHELQHLQLDEQLESVAYMHSLDMKENDNFSHVSLTKGELKDRLRNEEIPFLVAGENIAADYIDAIEVMEGWLNSKSHRENLLNDEFTHLGVGVYDSYYTQNFIGKLEMSATID